VRNPTLPLGLSLLLLAPGPPLLAASCGVPAPEQQSPEPPSSQSTNSTATDTAKTLLAGQFILQDATPVKLRLSRNVSSADAHEGESVDFEVLEDVAAGGTVVIPKGSIAIGTVTEAQPKRRMGRAGKLEIVLDYVRLADTEKAPVRAVKDAKGGSHTVGMTAGIVATGLLFFPAAPFFLFMHGKDITVPKGAEVTAYVNGDVRLESAKFAPRVSDATAANGAAQAPASAVQTSAPALATGSVGVHSTPDGAEVYVDDAFVGNAPATLKLTASKHSVSIKMTGYKDWSREISVQPGSDVQLAAALEKL
jgi:hypothetical protein